MLADERLMRIRAKIDRAKKHIGDLTTACEAFYRKQEDEVRHKTDPQTEKRIYYAPTVLVIPDEIPAIAGDALHNLRSALDHLACQLVEVNGAKPTRDTSFPISKNAKSKETEGMRQDAINAINGWREDSTLRRLHELDIIDKHRLLITVCLLNSAHSMTPSQRAKVIEKSRGKLSNPHDLFIASPVRDTPLKSSDELLTAPESEVGEGIRFRFTIALEEPEIIERNSVDATLQNMVEVVENITSDFRRFLG